MASTRSFAPRTSSRSRMRKPLPESVTVPTPVRGARRRTVAGAWRLRHADFPRTLRHARAEVFPARQVSRTRTRTVRAARNPVRGSSETVNRRSQEGVRTVVSARSGVPSGAAVSATITRLRLSQRHASARFCRAPAATVANTAPSSDSRTCAPAGPATVRSTQPRSSSPAVTDSDGGCAAAVASITPNRASDFTGAP